MIIAELNLKGAERVLDLGCGDGTFTSLSRTGQTGHFLNHLEKKWN